ncbi:MAG TPA: EMC3/TMCO1 family protein [archaeon]|nr:EMC3/TMCO1 family protein [archaeon]
MLEFLFTPLLNFNPALSVLIFSTIILFVINIFYKVLINQNDAKMIKQRVKEYNVELKDAQKKKETDRQKKVMSSMMSENSKLMKLTMKPMIVSLIIVVIFLPSMSGFYGDKFVASGGTVKLFDTNYTVVKDGTTVKINDLSCTAPCTQKIGGYDYKISMEDDNVKVAQIVAVMPFALPFIGGTFGWLGWYIICSMPLVMIMRRLMKIYV